MSPGQYQWCCGTPTANGTYISCFDTANQHPYVIAISSTGNWSFIELPNGAATYRDMPLYLGTDGGVWAVVTQTGPTRRAYHIPKNSSSVDHAVTLTSPTSLHGDVQITAYQDNVTTPIKAWCTNVSGSGGVYLQMPGGSVETVSAAASPSPSIQGMQADENGVVVIYFTRYAPQSGLYPAYGSLYRALRHTDGTYTIDTLFTSAVTTEGGKTYATLASANDSAMKNGHYKASVYSSKYSPSGGSAGWNKFVVPDEWDKSLTVPSGRV